MEPFEQLEHAWAEKNMLDPAGMVACASGTAALHLAFEAMRLPPDAEAIMPDLTMVACARAAVMAGCKPVFVSPDDGLLMERLYSRNYITTEYHPAKGPFTSALLCVHVYGRRERMDSLHSYRRSWRQNMAVIEDLAEAHGVAPHGETDAACWSFYRNKIVAGQEGGAVWFRDPKRAEHARCLRSLGFTPAHDFAHVPRGHNYRMSNAHAELVLASLAIFDTEVNRRRMIEEFYGKYCPEEWKMPKRDAPWVYDFRVRGMKKEQQDRVVAALQAAGFDARHCFQPMSEQEEFRGCRKVGGADAALKLSREVVYLPLARLDSGEVGAERAFAVVREALSDGAAKT